MKQLFLGALFCCFSPVAQAQWFGGGTINPGVGSINNSFPVEDMRNSNAEFEDGSDEFSEDVSQGDSPEVQKAQRVLDEYLTNVRAEGIAPNQDVIEILIGNGAVMPD